MNLLHRRILVCAVYLAAISFTDAYYMADTIWYAQSIAAGISELWEPLHLLWRPLGWLAWQVSAPLLSSSADVQGEIIITLVSVNLIAGFVAVLSLHNLLGYLVEQIIVVDFVTICFIFSQSFLNFAQSGSSYSVSLAFLLLGLSLLVKNLSRTSFSFPVEVGAGAALAISVGMWFPFIVVIPAAVMLPLFLFGWNKNTVKLMTRTVISGSIFLLAMYISVALYLGINNFGEFMAWFSPASYGKNYSSLAPMILGFPRSFISMADDGILFKRLLVQDPYNPVSLLDLVRPSLIELLLFYLTLLIVIINVLPLQQGRRIFALFFTGSLPVIALAIYWHGGDLERYLALYPFFFLIMAYSLANWHLLPNLKYIVFLYLIVQIATNISAMSTITLNREQERQVSRASDLLPLLKPQSVVFTLNQQDDLYQVNHSFPLNPTFRPYGEFTDAIIGLQWPRDFADKVLNIWQAGGDVWVSKRPLSPRPAANWYWAEGSTRGILWKEIHDHYSRLEWGQSVGGEDGFFLLIPSQNNIQMLNSPMSQK